MALSSVDSALVTSADAKTYLAGLSGTSAADTVLAELVEHASAAISVWCNRKFATATYTGELYDGSGTPSLYLDQWPITSVTSIYLDSTRVWSSSALLTEYTALNTAGDYYPHLLEQGQGLVERVNGSWAKGQRNIKATYVAGYATIPDAIRQACLRLIGHMYDVRTRGLHAVTSESIPGGSVTFIGHGMPDDVQQLILPYRRVAFY